MPGWMDVIGAWQKKNSAALQSYTDRYKAAGGNYAQATAPGGTNADPFALTDPDVVSLSRGGPAKSVQGQAAIAATAVKQTAPSPSPPLAPQGSPPQNQLQAANDLGAALAGQPQPTNLPKKKPDGSLVTGYRNSKLQANGMVA